MSEINPQELNEEIEYEVEDASVVPFPIDPTLTIEGEAADAKATGDAIGAIMTNLRINGKAPENSAVTLYGTDIHLSSSTGVQTISAAIEDLGGRSADDIMYDPVEMVSIKDVVDEMQEAIDTGIPDEEIDEIFDEVFGGDE